MSRNSLPIAVLVGWLSLASAGSAQSQLEWLTTHDEPTGQNNSAAACAVDSSGNVYAAGFAGTISSNQSDFGLVKFSPTSALLWSVLEDVYGSNDGATNCEVSAAGDVYVCGQSATGVAADTDAVLLKYSSAGVLQWTRGLPSPTGSNLLRAIAFDATGNVLVCGYGTRAATGIDVLVQSYSPAGALNWSTYVDGGATSVEDKALSLAVLSSGEIAVAGYIDRTASQWDFAIWKLSATGMLLWATSFDAGANTFDSAEVVVEGRGGKLVAGGFGGSAAAGDWLVVQLDSGTGSVDWTAYHDGTAHSYDRVRSIAVDAQGIAWVSGVEANLGTGFDFLTQRFDASGALLSSTTWSNGAGSTNDQSFKILLGSAGQAWVCGFAGVLPASADAVVVQLDSSGAFNWARTFTSAGTFADVVLDMVLAPGNRIAMAGRTDTGPSGDDDLLALQVDLSDSPQAYCTAKTTSTGCVPAVSFTGMPSAAAASGFVVRCRELRNHKGGLLFYGLSGALAAPFQGGTLCVSPPTARTPAQNSGGSALPASDCSGAYALDMNAFAAGALGGTPLPGLLVAGTDVCCQFWGRDPGFAPPQNTTLSNALRYVVLP